MSFKEHHIEYVKKLNETADTHGKTITGNASVIINRMFSTADGNLDALQLLMGQYKQAVVKSMINDGRKAVMVAKEIGNVFAKAKSV